MAEIISSSDMLHAQKAPLYRLGEWLIAWRKPVAIVTYAITAIFGYFALQLEMFTSFGDLVPYRHPFIAVHNKYAGQFGGANNVSIMVEVKDGTIFNVDTLTTSSTA
jgi:uncharacterized protein